MLSIFRRWRLSRPLPPRRSPISPARRVPPLSGLAPLAWLAWLAARAARRAPPPEGDEIGDLARAVHLFIQERDRLEQSGAELSRAQARLAQQNIRLQQEAEVRSRAESDLRGLMMEEQTILDNVGVGVAFLKERRIVRCNRSFAAMFGYPEAALLGMSTGRLHVSEQAYRERGGMAYAAVGVERSLTGDIQLKKRDGTVFWVERTLTAIDPANLSTGAIWVVCDIDQRKRAEAVRIEQGRVLEMIATGLPLEAVLDSLARLAESQCDGMMASISLLDEDGAHLRRGASPSLSLEALEALAGIPVGARGGSCGTAVARAATVIVEDALRDPLWDDWRPLAIAHGWRACWSTPILSQQRLPLGTLALYAGAARAPNPAEAHLMDVASRIAGIAIERRQSEERIRHMAHHDALTGLPNRSLLEDRLSQALAYARRHARVVAVVFIDLDNFKLVNDSLGHKAGDELLKAVAARMLRCVRASDTVVRLGGDEFVIVLCDQPDQIELIARTLQQIRAAVAQPVHVGGQALRVSCSMGLASYPADGADSETLLMNADAAMYRAKELGRDNVQFYSRALNVRAHERLLLQDGLRDALERDQLRLLYQPQRDARTGRVSGVEALAHWQHPAFGLVSPPVLAGLAEEGGLSGPIGAWALRAACRQSKAWQDAGMAPLLMSVALSPAQFRDARLPGQVAQALRDSALAPSGLELALCEGALAPELGPAILIMRQLQATGARLAVDGAGLAALGGVPIARVRIAPARVRGLPDSGADRASAAALIALGHRLDARVIAQGVENARQHAFLRDHDCDELQGEHVGAALGAEQIEALLRLPPVPG